jgi:hypothetical protein
MASPVPEASMPVVQDREKTLAQERLHPPPSLTLEIPMRKATATDDGSAKARCSRISLPPRNRLRHSAGLHQKRGTRNNRGREKTLPHLHLTYRGTAGRFMLLWNDENDGSPIVLYDGTFKVYLSVYVSGVGTAIKARASSDMIHWTEPQMPDQLGFGRHRFSCRTGSLAPLLARRTSSRSKVNSRVAGISPRWILPASLILATRSLNSSFFI